MGQEAERPWSNTPDLILSKIRSRIFGKDKTVFSAVCKAWKSLPYHVGEDDSLSPCLICRNNRVFHPLHNVYFQDQTMPTLPKGIILAQNHGWLLMKASTRLCPFFFHPFTNQRINLPNDSGLLDTMSITFINQPTSKHCEILTFNLEQLNEDDEEWSVTTVNTMKRGETGLTTVQKVRTSGGGRRFKFPNPPIYYQGEYYCLEKQGSMVRYNSDKNEHQVIEPPKHLWTYFSARDCSSYMFEGQGQLFAVFVAHQGKEVCVLKLNSTSMIWEMVDHLEDRMVFVSHVASFMETTNVREAGNKIYFPKLQDHRCLFYCLATKMYSTVQGSPASYESFHNSKEMVPCTWMKMNNPPPPTPKRENNLVW